MTHIIHVETNTTAEAVRRHLARIDSTQVALALPDGWTELDSIARLRLLQRQAQARNQQLALITQHLPTRRAAQQLGIPVFGSQPSLANQSGWRMNPALPPVDFQDPQSGLPEPPPWRAHGNGTSNTKAVAQAARPTLHRARQKRIRAEQAYRKPIPFWLQIGGYVLAGLFLVLLLGGFVFYVLPAATITVVPGQRQASATVPLTADPALDVPDLDAGVLPARLVETYVETTGSIATTGREQAATEPAVGTVVFSSQGNQTLRIPAGTIVSTSTGNRIDFRTVEPVEINGPAGSRASVAVEATEPGSQGNVRANTITTVSGGLRTQVRVTNPAPTGGGRSELVSVVKQADKDQLLMSVYGQIQDTAREKLLPQLREGEWLPRQSVQTFIVTQFFDHFNDEPADELNLTLRVLVQGVAVDEESARTAALADLQRRVPERAKLVVDSIQYFVEPGATVEERRVRFSVVAKGNYVIPIDARELRAAVAGLSPDEASQQLQDRWLLAKPPTFYQDPDWLGTLPVIPSRIQVRVQFSQSTAEQP